MNYEVTMSMTIMVQVDLCYPETTGPCQPFCELEQKHTTPIFDDVRLAHDWIAVASGVERSAIM